jgi:hypothetical protein
MIMKMLTHLHMVVYTWSCWRICQGEEVEKSLGVIILWKKVFWCALNYMLALGLEFYVDPLCFGSNMHVECVALYIRFLKYPRSSKSDFGAKSYSRSSDEHSVTGRCDQTLAEFGQ